MTERTHYAGWPNCYRLSNGTVELVVTADVGPRIIRCGFVGGRNLFAEFPDQLGKSGEPYWMPRGGHRLWIAPELVPDTYALDNSPVDVRLSGETITLVQPVEPGTGLQKELSIELTGEAEVRVVHRVKNCGTKPKRFAPWALTQMAPGGVGVAAFPPRGHHHDRLLPTNPLAMWFYTDFSDKRWRLTRQYLILRQEAANHSPQKAGLFNPDTFAAYLLGTDLFAKRTQANPQAIYPDFHCSCELFTNGDFLELETLGPLTDVAPGDSVTHVEDWFLRRNVQLDGFTDEGLDAAFNALRI
ncbi:MAG TPA: hypothetical protein VFB14_19625 [Bryobacteraceae bacterium]|jgi:hypothetical protein|nr:hypothetical protein [Bryobacteraceae bacterium]